LQSFVELEQVTQTDANFDWNLFTQKLWKDTDEPTGSELDAGPGSKRRLEEDFSLEVGTRKANRIGGQFEASQNLRLHHTNSQFFDPNDQGISRLTLRYNQPLLKNGGRLVNEGQVVLAQFLAESARSDYDAKINDVLLKVVQAYWELYRSRAEYCIQRALVANTQELLEELGLRRRIDAQPALIAQVESQLAAQLAEIVATRVKIQRFQHELVRQVGDRGLDSFEELIPAEIPSAEPMSLDLGTVFSVALQNRGELRSALKRIQGSQIGRDIARRQLLPQLALILESNVTGVNGNYQLFQSVGDQFSDRAPSYSVGFNFEVPFGNRAARSRVRQTELSVAREAAFFEDAVDQIRQEVRDALAALQSYAGQAGSRDTAVKQAKAEVHALLERRRIFPEEFDQVSQLYIRTYLDALQRRASAEQSLIAAHVDYSIALVQFRRAMGVLLTVGPM
jgi:outer membrane protein TolC